MPKVKKHGPQVWAVINEDSAIISIHIEKREAYENANLLNEHPDREKDLEIFSLKAFRLVPVVS